MNEKYDVFISYRRDGGESTAKMLHDKLENLGYRVFFDVESLRSGNFNTALYSVIDECKDFLLVLSPNALDRCKNENDWVRLEIEHALEQELNIIPIMLRGFSFPEELPSSIDEVRYKNGIEASYNFFDAFIDKLQKFLVSEHSGTRRRKPKRLLIGAVFTTILLGTFLTIWFVNGRQDPVYPRTNYEINVTKDLIYYFENILLQMEQAIEYLDESYLACNEYIDNFDTASYSALLAELSQYKRLLKEIDTDSNLMSDDLQNALRDSPFDLVEALAMHDLLISFVKNSVETLEFMEVLTDDATFIDFKTMKNVISNYQEMTNEECKLIAYSTNEMFLVIKDEEVLKEFKYTFLPTFYYIKLQASNWNNDKKSLESDIERSLNVIDKAKNRNLAIVGDDKLELMLIKTEMIQQLMSEGVDYETAEMIVNELNGRTQLVVEKELSLEELKKEVEEKRQAAVKAELYLEGRYDEIREKCTPSLDDDGELFGKMRRLLKVRLYDEAIECINVYHEKKRSENEQVEDYCDALVRFVKNINKTGIDYGILIAGYDPDDPHKQYKVGDVIIAVNGIPCYNIDEYSKIKDEIKDRQNFNVVVLRQDMENPDQLKQIKLEIPSDEPKCLRLDVSEKEFDMSTDDDSDVLLEKMSHFFGENLPDEAIMCVDVYREKMRDKDKYVEEYCAALVRCIRNMRKLGCNYGVMVIGYDSDDSLHNEQLKIGDVIISVDTLVLFSVCKQEGKLLVRTIEIETAYRVMFKDYPDVLKAEEVSKMLGIGRKQVYNLIQNGRLQKIPCGRAVKIAKTNVIDYVLQCAQENT